MIAATCGFMSYVPQAAPDGGSAPVRSRRTAGPEHGWFAPHGVMKKVSTALVPLLGIAAAPADAVMAPVAREVFLMATQVARTDARNALLRDLIDYQFLPHDWDGYDGLPANPRATLDALKFLLQLPSGLPLPSPMLAGSGVVGLYWDWGDHYASLEFEGDGTYTLLTDSPAGYGGAEGIAAGTTPAELRQYLATLPVG